MYLHPFVSPSPAPSFPGVDLKLTKPIIKEIAIKYVESQAAKEADAAAAKDNAPADAQDEAMDVDAPDGGNSVEEAPPTPFPEGGDKEEEPIIEEPIIKEQPEEQEQPKEEQQPVAATAEEQPHQPQVEEVAEAAQEEEDVVMDVQAEQPPEPAAVVELDESVPFPPADPVVPIVQEPSDTAPAQQQPETNSSMWVRCNVVV